MVPNRLPHVAPQSEKVWNDEMIKFAWNVGTDKVLLSLCAVTLKNLSFWHVVLVAPSCFHADVFDNCKAWTWSQVKHFDWERCWKEFQAQATMYFCNIWLPGSYYLNLLSEIVFSEFLLSVIWFIYFFFNYKETSVATHPGSSCWFRTGRYFPASPPWGLWWFLCFGPVILSPPVGLRHHPVSASFHCHADQGRPRAIHRCRGDIWAGLDYSLHRRCCRRRREDPAKSSKDIYNEFCNEKHFD